MFFFLYIGHPFSTSSNVPSTMDTNLRSIATSPPISLGTPFQYKFGEEIFKSDEDGEYTEEELRLNTLSNTHHIETIYKQYTDPHTTHHTPLPLPLPQSLTIYVSQPLFESLIAFFFHFIIKTNQHSLPSTFQVTMKNKPRKLKYLISDYKFFIHSNILISSFFFLSFSLSFFYFSRNRSKNRAKTPIVPMKTIVEESSSFVVRSIKSGT